MPLNDKRLKYLKLESLILKLLGIRYKRWSFQKIKIPKSYSPKSKYVKTKCKQWASRFKNQHARHWDGEGYYHNDNQQ
jgi:hypothetical protein